MIIEYLRIFFSVGSRGANCTEGADTQEHTLKACRFLYGDRIMEVMTSWGEMTCCLVTVWITAREAGIHITSLVSVRVCESLCVCVISTRVAR